MYVGNTRGYRRTHGGYTATPQTPKMVFLRPLRPDACQILCGAILSPPYRLGGTTMRLTAEQMRSLPSFFSQISDPRRAQGRRHRLSMVLGIAAGAVLCGMRGYQAISDWARTAPVCSPTTKNAKCALFFMAIAGVARPWFSLRANSTSGGFPFSLPFRWTASGGLAWMIARSRPTLRAP